MPNAIANDAFSQAAIGSVLVCVTEDPRCAGTIRRAHGLARQLDVPWIALYVETPRHQQLRDRARARIADALRSARDLGAEALTVPGASAAAATLHYVRAHDVGWVLVCQSRIPRPLRWLRYSLADDLLQRGAGTSALLVVDGRGGEPVARASPRHRSRRPAGFGRYPGAAATMLAALLAGLGIRQFLSGTNAELIFLAGILFIAVRWGLGPSLLGCVLGVLSLNYFFFPPLYDFGVHDPENIVAVSIFVAVAVFVSRLTARSREQAALADKRAKVAGELYAFSRKVAGIGELDDLLWATACQVAALIEVDVVLLLPEDEELVVRAGFPPEDALNGADLAAAHRCWSGDTPSGRDTQAPDGAHRLFLPLRTVRGPVAVIGISRAEDGPLLSPDDRRLLDAILDQVAVAIERIRLADTIETERVTTETERLRSAMLSSISHDLKTPLASILGCATSLRSYGSYYEQEARQELVATIEEEAERMSRFVANLLDITRLESGNLRIRKEATDLEEIVGAAAKRARAILGTRRLRVSLPPDLPMLDLDGVLLEQTLFNLLDNASKYSPPDSTITIDARRVHGRVMLKVVDEGPGISPVDRKRIFEKFYRATSSGRQRAGTGLGLAICRGFVEAMGGRIIAGNRTDRSGAVFMIGFPVATGPAARPAESVDA